jgi:hypothetical protein
MPEEPDIGFLARQQERILAEIGSLRDDMSVVTSIVLRQDGTLNALLQEVRVTHTQIQRMNERVRKLESQSP